MRKAYMEQANELLFIESRREEEKYDLMCHIISVSFYILSRVK
jgi:hypothetical protein